MGKLGNPIPIENRFWVRVKKTDTCWLWTGTKTRGGYGRVWFNKRNQPVTKIAWLLTYGEKFPEGLDACHKCDNPSCVRPDHIFPGTALDNMRDAKRKGRLNLKGLELGNRFKTQTHCKRGHEFTPDNTYVHIRGGGRLVRNCRQCTTQRRCPADALAEIERLKGGE